MGAATITRRTKWQYPPPQPPPKILHFPSRPRKKPPKPSPSKLQPQPSCLQNDTKGKLVSLFDQERSFTRENNEDTRRERVEENEGIGLVEEEKWRFQAEMLRAECNLLRMERDIAVKKMERRRVETERTLKSAVQTLVSNVKKPFVFNEAESEHVRHRHIKGSNPNIETFIAFNDVELAIVLQGRNHICEGKNARLVLEEQINDLLEKLDKMQKRSGVKDLEVKKCSNFDKQVSFLQRRLEKFGGMSDEEICVKEIREMAEASLSIQTSSKSDDSFVSNRNSSVEILGRKMERLSKGVLLERMEEEYGSMLSTTNSSAASSKRIDYSDLSLPSTRHSYEEKMPHEARMCSGHCKAIVLRLVEQVRAETEQWSQMQEMLWQVRDEMEELQKSRDFWEDRAIDSDYQIQSLQSAVKEWRQKALSSEAKANEIQTRTSVLHEKDRKTVRSRNTSPTNQEAQNEAEKKILVCRLKENRCAYEDGYKAQTCTAGGLFPRRSPLREIGNMSALMKQHGEGMLPLFCLGKDQEMKR